MLVKVKDHAFSREEIIFIRPHVKKAEDISGVVVRFRDGTEVFFNNLCADDFLPSSK